MIRPVQNRPGQVVEARVEQIERVAAHLLDRANLADQVAALGNQVAARLDFQRDLVAEFVLQPLAAGVPQLEILVEIDVGLPLAIGRRQAAAGADRGDRAADRLGRLFHRAADLGQVLQVGAAADVHVQAGDDRP